MAAGGVFLDTNHHAGVVTELERLGGHELTYVDVSSPVFLGA